MPPIKKEKLYLSAKKLSLFVSKEYIKADKKNNIDKEKADGRRNIPVKKENLPKSSIKFNFNRNALNKNINTVISILTLKLIKSKVKVFFLKLINFTLPAGFEPAAHCLEGSCSIQLS